jgi:hypothetical protein
MIEDIFRVALGLPPSNKKIQQDLQVMHKETTAWRDNLIPWEDENEIELFSLMQEKKWIKQTWDRLLKGVFYSIYHEPMMTFAYKNYIRGGKNALLYVRTIEYEFIYRIRKKKSDVYVNGQFVAEIRPDGLMYGGRFKRLLGRMRVISEEYFGIVIWDKEVAHLLNPDKADRVNPRAFELMEKLNEQEETMFLALAFHEIILRLNNLK